MAWMATRPVNHTVGLFCADDAQGVDGCVRRRQVGVLAWAPSKASSRTLTPSKKLAHAAKEEFSQEAAGPVNQSAVPPSPQYLLKVTTGLKTTRQDCFCDLN